MGKFADQVAAHRRKVEQRLRAAARGSVLDVVELAQRTRSRAPPGRMPLVTGFLRASIQGAVGSMPSGPTTNEGNKDYTSGGTVAGEPPSVAVLRWDPETGEEFFVGWTAVYARAMEAKYGFLRGAVEMWKPIVEGNAIHAKRKIP